MRKRQKVGKKAKQKGKKVGGGKGNVIKNKRRGLRGDGSNLVGRNSVSIGTLY
jgi:hypothetical protein